MPETDRWPAHAKAFHPQPGRLLSSPVPGHGRSAGGYATLLRPTPGRCRTGTEPECPATGLGSWPPCRECDHIAKLSNPNEDTPHAGRAGEPLLAAAGAWQDLGAETAHARALYPAAVPYASLPGMAGGQEGRGGERRYLSLSYLTGQPSGQLRK